MDESRTLRRRGSAMLVSSSSFRVEVRGYCSIQPVFSDGFQREECVIIIRPTNTVLFSSVACLPFSPIHTICTFFEETRAFYIFTRLGNGKRIESCGYPKHMLIHRSVQRLEIPGTSMKLTCTPHFAS